MKTAFAVLALLAACLIIGGCYADSTSRFQSVGGDYGQSWISNFKAANPAPAQQQNSTNNSLWNWGNAPKGSLVVNGKLQADPYYYWKSLNLSSGWMGDAYVDPYSGNQVYGYVDPNTGEKKFFYMDSNTGRPVFVSHDPSTDTPTYGSVSPFYASNDWSGTYALPPVYNSNSIWS